MITRLTRSAATAFGSVLLLAFAPAGFTGAQPISFPTSMSVGDGDLILRVQPWWLSAAGDDATGWVGDWRVRTMASFGLSRNWTLFGAVPLIDRQWRTSDGNRRLRGLGDLSVVLRNTPFEWNQLRRTFSVSPFVGVTLPTGRQEGFPSGMVLGTGRVAYVIGFALRDATLARPHRFLSAQWTVHPDRGDIVEVNAAIKPGLVSWKSGSGESVGINGMLEANYDLRRRRAGGHTLRITPGVVHTRRRWIIEAAVRIPIYRSSPVSVLRERFAILVGVWHNL